MCQIIGKIGLLWGWVSRIRVKKFLMFGRNAAQKYKVGEPVPKLFKIIKKFSIKVGEVQK